jgi:hypothetical protein
MVALGMLPKDDEFRKLKHRMETLEEQNSYLLSMVMWITQCHGGAFHPPTTNWSRTPSVVVQPDKACLSSPQVHHAKI